MVYKSTYDKGLKGNPKQRIDIRLRHFLYRKGPVLFPAKIWKIIVSYLFVFEQLIRRSIRNFYSHPSERLVEYDWVLKSIDHTKRNILDFGAGDSLLPSYLNCLGFNVFILDLFWYPVQKSAGIQFVQGDVLYAPFPDGTFDQIIAVSVIEHIENDQWCLSELGRVLQPGGQMIITVPLGKGYYNNEKLTHFEMEDFIFKKTRYLFVDKNEWVSIEKEKINDKMREKGDSFKGLACLVLKKRDIQE